MVASDVGRLEETLPGRGVVERGEVHLSAGNSSSIPETATRVLSPDTGMGCLPGSCLLTSSAPTLPLVEAKNLICFGKEL